MYYLLSASRLLAGDKGCGKIRPIGIASLFDKLVGACVHRASIDAMRDNGKNIQRGVAVSWGVETTVHRARVHMLEHTQHVMISLDGVNCFNNLSRPNLREILAADTSDSANARQVYFRAKYGREVPLAFPHPRQRHRDPRQHHGHCTRVQPGL